MAKKNNINNSALSKLCSYIALASQQGQLINDTLQAQDKVFSSKHVTDLINSMSEQDKKYVDDIVANLNKLSSKTTSVIPDSSNAEPNTLYLYSADPNPTSYNQYMVLSDKTILDLGDTNISLEGYLKETDADDKYLKQVDSHSHSNKLILDSISQDKIDKLDKAVDENKVKEIIDSERPITTTIDSTSTDTQIPSAKAIYNMSGVKFFTEEEINSYGNSTFLSGIVDKTTAATVIPNAVDYYNLIKLPWDGKFNSQIWISACGRQDAYIRYTKIEGVWDTPKKICTTKVADVAKTAISPEASTATIQKGYYQVKNGICYVTIYNMLNTSIQRDVVILSNMPKNDSGVWSLLPLVNDGTGQIVGSVCIGGSSTTLMTHFFVANVPGSCHFSYPVAES